MTDGPRPEDCADALAYLYWGGFPGELPKPLVRLFPEVKMRLRTWIIYDKNGKAYRVERGGRGKYENLFNVYTPEQTGQIAYAWVSVMDLPFSLRVSDVMVDYEYRRLGICSALYDLIETIYERKLHPYPIQHDDGRNFWYHRMNERQHGVHDPRAGLRRDDDSSAALPDIVPLSGRVLVGDGPRDHFEEH